MLNKINPIYNVNFAHKPNPKIDVEAPITNPIQPNVSFKGLDAVANYNIANVNKNNPMFDIPEVELIYNPEDINSIKGEKIYDSKGNLVKIIDKNEMTKTIYTPTDYEHGLYDAKVYDINTGELLKSQHCGWNNYVSLLEYGKSQISADYEFKDGKLILKKLIKQISDRKYSHYDIKTKSWKIVDGENFYYYDKNKNLTKIENWQSNESNESTTYYKDNKPSHHVDIKTTVTPKDVNPFEDKELVLTPKDEIPDITNINGKKSYYSNGVIEEIKTKNGEIYHFSPEGKLDGWTKDNKEFFIDDCTLTKDEKLADGRIKVSDYCLITGLTAVFIKNPDNSYKQLVYNPDGSVESYSEDSYNGGFMIEYNADRSIKKIVPLEPIK